MCVCVLYVYVCVRVFVCENQMSVCARKSQNTSTAADTRVCLSPWSIQLRSALALSLHTLQHPATHRNTLQHSATHCNTLQHSATHCNTPQHTATQCNTLQHTATHCTTLQHTATQCNTRSCTQALINIQAHATATHKSYPYSSLACASKAQTKEPNIWLANLLLTAPYIVI